MKTNTFKQYMLLMLMIFGMVSCDKEGELDEEKTGYITLTTKIDFQANKDRSYKMVVNGKEIKENEQLYLPRTEEKILFQVFRDNETTPELQEEIEMENGGVISLVQLPESKISLAGFGTVEEDPETRNIIKARFFYAQQDLGKSIKVDVFVWDTGASEMIWNPLTSITLEQGKIGEYIELDLAMFYEKGEGLLGNHRPFLKCEITNLDTGEKILNLDNWVIITFDHPTLYLPADENGDRSAYKFATFELQESYGSFMFNPVFGTLWEDMKPKE